MAKLLRVTDPRSDYRKVARYQKIANLLRPPQTAA